jgi:hypothetical protein
MLTHPRFAVTGLDPGHLRRERENHFHHGDAENTEIPGC